MGAQAIATSCHSISGTWMRSWRNKVDLELPDIFSKVVQEDLKRDATVCRLVSSSQYFFEIGMRVAYLQRDEALQKSLLAGLVTRWKEIVTLLCKFGVAETHQSPLNAGFSIFPNTLTALEHLMLTGGKEAEKHFKKWMDEFAIAHIEASSIVEPAGNASKRARKGL